MRTKSTTYATSTEVKRTLPNLSDGVTANKLLSNTVGQQEKIASLFAATHWNYIQPI